MAKEINWNTVLVVLVIGIVGILLLNSSGILTGKILSAAGPGVGSTNVGKWLNATTIGKSGIIYESLGKIGIGTSKPSEKLDVVGNINAQGLNVNNLNVRGESAQIWLKSLLSEPGATAKINFGNDINDQVGSIGNPGSGEYLEIFSKEMIVFNANFLERMRIDGSGNVLIDGKVGIGTSPDRQSKLHIKGDPNAVIFVESPSAASQLTLGSGYAERSVLELRGKNSAQIIIAAESLPGQSLLSEWRVGATNNNGENIANFVIYNAKTGSTPFGITQGGSIKMSNLAGEGTNYVCVDNTGTLFNSPVPCVS